MANFNTHFAVAAIASAVVSGTLLSMEVINPEEAVATFALGTFGGLMPDLDSDNSKAIKVGFTVVSLLVTIILVFIKSSTYSIVEMLIMSAIVFYLIRFGIISLFRKVSKHRGMFHSIPVALIWGVGTAIMMHLFFDMNSMVSWIYGFMMSFGYLVHLTLDEIYSVDLGNRRVKSSFGTALKFFKLKTSRDKIQNGIIYLVLFLLLAIAPDTTLLQDAIFSQEAWLNFKDVLLPYDGKWFFH